MGKNIEEFFFWTGDVAEIHFAKQELLSQLEKFDITIHAKGFYELNRNFLASVSGVF